MKNLLIILSVVLSSTQLLAAVSKEVRIGTEGAYAPFNYIDAKGELKGFDVDISKALCAEMKVKCSFVTQAWDGMIPALMVKKFDAIVGQMSITEARKKKVAFSNPYYQGPARFTVKKGTKIEFTKAGLKGKTIGVQKATTHLNYLKANYKGIIKIKQYDTLESHNLDLKAGRVDAVLAEGLVMQEWMQKHGEGKFAFSGPKLFDPKWFGEGAGIAIRKADKDLVLAFNKALKAIRDNGTYDRIYKKHFPNLK